MRRILWLNLINLGRFLRGGVNFYIYEKNLMVFFDFGPFLCRFIIFYNFGRFLVVFGRFLRGVNFSIFMWRISWLNLINLGHLWVSFWFFYPRKTGKDLGCVNNRRGNLLGAIFLFFFFPNVTHSLPLQNGGVFCHFLVVFGRFLGVFGG